MKLALRLLSKWPILAGALVAAGIVHIVTVLAMPQFHRSDAVTRLLRSLPLNVFVVLPPAKPGAQVLPYQQPDTRYAICRYNLIDGPIAVKATLPEPGWTLSAYSATGESYFAMPAPEGRRLSISLLVLPGGERFLGPLTDARSLDADTSQVTAPQRTGMIVIQAPMKGRTYKTEVEQTLAQATCRKLGF